MSSKLRYFHGQVVVCFCMFAVAFAIGCGGDTESEKDTSPATKPAAAKSDSAKSSKNKKAKREAKAQKRQENAAKDYPRDVPLYAGANIVESQLAKKGGGVSVTLETTDALLDAVSNMSSMLEKDGWFVQATTRGETHFIFADKGTRNLSIDVWSMKNGKGTSLRLLVFDLK